jgi:hypothetical protein
MNHKPLPMPAQLSAINGIVVDDIDGDGHLDILAAGNLMEMEAETLRNDAGTGVFLKGDGGGSFTPLRAHQCGLYVYGDVKDVEMVELNGKKVFLFSNNSGRLEARRFK